MKKTNGEKNSNIHKKEKLPQLSRLPAPGGGMPVATRNWLAKVKR